MASIAKFAIGSSMALFGDIDLSDINRGNDDIHNALQIDRAWAIGARAGYLVTNRTLVFATAGYTEAHFQNDGWWDIDVDPS